MLIEGYAFTRTPNHDYGPEGQTTHWYLVAVDVHLSSTRARKLMIAWAVREGLVLLHFSRDRERNLEALVRVAYEGERPGKFVFTVDTSNALTEG